MSISPRFVSILDRSLEHHFLNYVFKLVKIGNRFRFNIFKREFYQDLYQSLNGNLAQHFLNTVVKIATIGNRTHSDITYLEYGKHEFHLF